LDAREIIQLLHKKEQAAENWSKSHHEELHNLHSSPTIFRLIKPRMRWAKRVTSTEMRNVYRAADQKTERRKRLLRKLSVDGKTFKLSLINNL
jgi:hypothetical protein